jgi:putative flippase GtrA
MKVTPIPRPHLVKYAAVIVLGFAIDFGVTLSLSRGVGLRLEVSAALGFLVALALNYGLFEFWVFHGEHAFFSLIRLLQTGLAAGTALSVRVGVIWFVQRFLGTTLADVMLAILLGFLSSFAVNYLLLRLIFAPPGMAMPWRSPPITR